MSRSELCWRKGWGYDSWRYLKACLELSKGSSWASGPTQHCYWEMPPSLCPVCFSSQVARSDRLTSVLLSGGHDRTLGSAQAAARPLKWVKQETVTWRTREDRWLSISAGATLVLSVQKELPPSPSPPRLMLERCLKIKFFFNQWGPLLQSGPQLFPSEN